MFIDMHSHSVSSDDSRATVEGYLKWVQVLRKRGFQLDAIVLTEHRKFDADADYSYLSSQYDVLVLKGSELDTAYGHFLVYGVTPELTGAVDFSNVRMDPRELMTAAEAHGAIAVPAHPGRPGTGVFDHIQKGTHVDGFRIVELLNGGSRRGENERALELARERSLHGIGGSDAHLVSSISACVTRFLGEICNEAELVGALLTGDYSPHWLEETRDGLATGEGLAQ